MNIVVIVRNHIHIIFAETFHQIAVSTIYHIVVRICKTNPLSLCYFNTSIPRDTHALILLCDDLKDIGVLRFVFRQNDAAPVL